MNAIFKPNSLIKDVKMSFEWNIILILIVLNHGTISNCEDNIRDKNVTYEDFLKTKFECIPPQNYDLITLGKTRTPINNVCLEKQYQVNDAPERNQLTEVSVIFNDKRLIDVNEKEGFVTFDVKILTFWEDKRIRYKMDGNNDILLPDITKENVVIWHPFISFVIRGLKELKFIFDPIIAKELRLGYMKKINDLMKRKILEPNEVRVAAIFKWITQVSCDMDFSDYPFDHHTCRFLITAENLNVTVFDPPKLPHLDKTQEKAKGFFLKRDKIEKYSKNPLYGNVTPFGFEVNMTRQLKPYIYQYYIPCVVVVSTSFLSFIISFTSIPARVSLTVTLFLTLTNMCIHEMVRNQNPKNGSFVIHKTFLKFSLLYQYYHGIFSFSYSRIVQQELDSIC